MAFKAFDIYIPELGIRDIQFLPTSDNSIRLALIYEYHGKRHIKVYALDVTSRSMKELFSSNEISDSSCCIIPGIPPLFVHYLLKMIS